MQFFVCVQVIVNHSFHRFEYFKSLLSSNKTNPHISTTDIQPSATQLSVLHFAYVSLIQVGK